MTLPEYLADAARELTRRSQAIRRDFAPHRLSAGENRQDLVADLLSDIFPKRFGVGTGLVFSSGGEFSNQADLLVVDELNNAPLYPDSTSQLWPVEAVYALIEVKTHLSPSDIEDAVAKGRRFKSLSRDFQDRPHLVPQIDHSLFVIWAFEAPGAETVKQNLTDALALVPVYEQPDLVVAPDRLVVQAGQYREIARLGQPNSEHRRALESRYGSDLSGLPDEALQVFDLGEHALMAWYVWCDSWLRSAGPRAANPLSYLTPGREWGRQV